MLGRVSRGCKNQVQDWCRVVLELVFGASYVMAPTDAYTAHEPYGSCTGPVWETNHLLLQLPSSSGLLIPWPIRDSSAL